jgi:hypothetical protein
VSRSAEDFANVFVDGGVVVDDENALVARVVERSG